MGISIQFPTVLYALITVVCALTGILLLMFSKSANAANKLLGLSYLSFSFIYIVVFAIDSRLILQLPHLYRVGNLFGLLFMPLSYLCIRTFISGKNPGYKDLVHAIPAVLYFIDLAPFLFSSAEHKIQILTYAMQNRQAVTQFNETWLLPGKFYTIERSMLMAFYWVLQVLLIINLYRKEKYHDFLQKNSNWIKWQKVYNSLQFFVFFPTLFFLVIGMERQLYQVVNLSSGISVLLTAFSMFFYPGILYSVRNLEIFSWKNDAEYQLIPVKLPASSNDSIKDFQKGTNGLYLSHLNQNFESSVSQKVKWNYKARTSDPLDISNEGERKYYHFTTEQVEQITGQLNELMEKEKPFLKEGYSIRELALQINLPAYQLSAFINIETGMHFNDFINRLRISYCEELIEKGESDNLNLFGLAAKCGFHNRNTFTAAFKKYTGLTPSAFLKSNQKYLNSNNG